MLTVDRRGLGGYCFRATLSANGRMRSVLFARYDAERRNKEQRRDEEAIATCPLPHANRRASVVPLRGNPVPSERGTTSVDPVPGHGMDEAATDLSRWRHGFLVDALRANIPFFPA
jgi:hypothetical protein